MAVREKHPHYHKNVAHLNHIDVYRVLERFGVTDPTVQHAVKKLLVSGGRGVKDQLQDVTEAIDSLNRYVEMYHENAQEELPTPCMAEQFVRQPVVTPKRQRSTPVDRKKEPLRPARQAARTRGR